MGVPSVNSSVASVVTSTITTEVAVAESAEALTPQQPSTNFGVVKQAPAQIENFKNDGKWNAGDRTGNNALDQSLDNFYQLNKGNPQALQALENTAAAIKADPQKFIKSDGSVDKKALGDLVMQQFSVVHEVSIPSVSFVQSEDKSLRQTSGDQQGSIMNVKSNGHVYKNLGNLADGDIMACAFIVMCEAANSAREDLKSIMDGVKAINKQKEGWRTVNDAVNQMSASLASKNDDQYADRSSANNEAYQPSSIATNAKGGPNMGNYTLGYDGPPGSNGGPAQQIHMNCPDPNGGVVQGGFTITATGTMPPYNDPLTKKDIDNAKETVKGKLDSLSEMGEMESLRLQMAMDRLSKLMSTLSNLLKKASDTDQGITQNIK
jgi:hypothetical protein